MPPSRSSSSPTRSPRCGRSSTPSIAASAHAGASTSDAMSLVFLIGGARSGKSSLAVRLAAESGASVVFIATGEPRDAEMAERVDRHRAERPTEWETIEEPVALRGALEATPRESCVVVDCLSLWVANLLETGVEEVEREARAAAAVAVARAAPTVAVTYE